MFRLRVVANRNPGRHQLVVVRLKGGLGNQMFQFAFGTALSERFGLSVLYDDLWYRTTSKRYTHGNSFAIVEGFRIDLPTSPGRLDRKVRFPFDRRRPWRSVASFLATFSGARLEYVADDEETAINPVDLRRDNIYYDGYWQDPVYFSMLSETLRRAFVPRAVLSSANQEVAKLARESNSVAVHVRRGDYVTSPLASSYHGFLGVLYYQKAMRKIEEEVEAPRYFVFSDDPEWARNHLPGTSRTKIIDWNNGPRSVNDIYLMSCCKHNIIANSTFSWWGAWLNPNRAKIVVAPVRWFRDPSRHTPLLMAGWKTV